MAVAQGISTTVSRVAQSALGSPGSTGSKLARRVTLSLNKQSDTYNSNEIASHQQSTGATEGPSGIQGSLAGEISAGTYQIELENLLRKAAAATTAITGAGLTIAASGSLYTITRAAGSWLTDGIKVGDVVRLSAGALNAANITRNLLVTDVGSATVITVTPSTSNNRRTNRNCGSCNDRNGRSGRNVVDRVGDRRKVGLQHVGARGTSDAG